MRGLFIADPVEILEAFDYSSEDNELFVEGRHGCQCDVELSLVTIGGLAAK